MVQADLPRSPDDPYQSVRHVLLLAGGPACVPRDRGPPHDVRRSLLCAGTKSASGARRARESAGDVLALRRWRVGSCFHGCVHPGTMMEPRDPNVAGRPRGETQSGVIHLPAPTAWPFMLALGVTLISASLVTNLWIGALGLLLFVISVVGWFRS